MNAKEEYLKNGTVLNKPRIESGVEEGPAEYMLQRRSSESTRISQITVVTAGFNWQYIPKNKMLN